MCHQELNDILIFYFFSLGIGLAIFSRPFLNCATLIRSICNQARVIEEIREDRARRAERDARERTSRARREAAAAAAVAAAAAAGPEAEVTASGIASLSRTASQALPRTRVERQASDDLDTDGDDDYEDEDEDDEMGKPRLFGGRGNVLGGS